PPARGAEWVHGSGGTVSASIRRRWTRVRERPTRSAPHRRSDGAPAPVLRRYGPRVHRARPPCEAAATPSARSDEATKAHRQLALRVPAKDVPYARGPNSAAGRRGRRRSAYEAPRAAADRGTRLGGAESKRRRRPRLPAPPSRVTLLRGPAGAAAPAAPAALIDVAGDRGGVEAVGLQVAHETLRGAAHVDEDERAQVDGLAPQEADQEAELLVLGHVVDEVLDLLRRHLLGRDRDPHRVVHEHVGELHDVVAERRREEHRLAAVVGRELAQEVAQALDEAHVEHAVGFVDDQDLHAAEIEDALLVVVDQPPGRADQDVDAGAQLAPLLVVVDAAVHRLDAERRGLAQQARVVRDLHHQLAR